MFAIGGVTYGPPVPAPHFCSAGYRYIELKYGVEDFVVYLGQSGQDADEALEGSPGGGLTLEGPRFSTADYLTITRTFFPPDSFNLLFVGLVVHGPTLVIVDVRSAQDPHREKVGDADPYFPQFCCE